MHDLTADEYLAVPYVLVMESIRQPDGTWIRRAEYPELPNCRAEAWSALEALDKLEELRVQRIMDLIARGEPVPVPRPPLRDRLAGARIERQRWEQATRANGHPR